MDNINNKEGIEAPVAIGLSHHRQSILLKPNRRSTFFVNFSGDQNEPPVENPDNSDVRNEKLKQEYERIKDLNEAIEITADHFDKAKSRIRQFSDTIDHTDALLDKWLSILKGTEQTKVLIDDPDWHGVRAGKRKEPTSSNSQETHNNHNGIRRRRANE